VADVADELGELKELEKVGVEEEDGRSTCS